MHTRSFWALDEDDAHLVDRLAAGLGRTPARVLAYLLLRESHEDVTPAQRQEPTTSIHLQVGTGHNRTTIGDATARLEALGLVERSSVRDRDSEPGRPQTAWEPIGDVETTVRRVYREHARELLELAAACHDGVSSTDVFADSSPPGSVDLALNWRPNALHVPIYAGLESGWYDTVDLDVRLDHRNGSRRALDRVSSGTADVGVAGAATVVRARAEGSPVVPIAVLYQRAMTVLYTVREVFGDPLTSVAQLENRRIGMPPSSETRLLGRLFLSQTAFSEDVRIVDTNGEEQDALGRGDADVVTGSVADPQQLERQNEDVTVDVLQLTDHFPIYGPTIVVHEDALTNQPAALEAFLAGTTAGWAVARHDAGPAAERIASQPEADESAARIAGAFDRAATAFGDSDAVRDRGWGWQREPMWERLRTALDQAEVLA